jgi:ribosomal protein L37E
MIYEQGELEPLFAEVTSEEITTTPPHSTGESESSPDSETKTSEITSEQGEVGQKNTGQEAQKTERVTSDEPEECPHCGKKATFDISDETGQKYCNSCGFTPEESDVDSENTVPGEDKTSRNTPQDEDYIGEKDRL